MAANATMVIDGYTSLAMTVASLVWNPPLPGFLLYIPVLCRLLAIILATPFALFTILDVIAYAIARTLHISLRSLRVPHSPTTQSSTLAPHPSVVPLTPSASALSLIQDSGSETEDAETDEMPRPSVERRRSEKGLQMTNLEGGGLRMRKISRQEQQQQPQGLALHLSSSSTSSINVAALSQFSVESSAASTPRGESPPAKEFPILGPPFTLASTQTQTQTAYPSPPLSPAHLRKELAPVS